MLNGFNFYPPKSTTAPYKSLEKKIWNCPQKKCNSALFLKMFITLMLNDEQNIFHIEMVLWGKFWGQFFMQESQYWPLFLIQRKIFPTFSIRGDGPFLESKRSN